ncbi:zinc finger protein 888-like [Belonocnema kinseyi]|uniref:zinc finger protein 888-like n=1 Tax=Belonocnema kinseyi TaxID=2817044 RepID=UPI00143D3294|nr:zinc finger protein 888-like [Belonocnema kinseyi]
MIEIECSNYETLEINEETIEDQDTTGQKLSKNYDSKFCTVYIRESDDLAVNNKLVTHKKKKIYESKQKPEVEHKCKKCARSYKYKKNLNHHLKFECGVMRQFRCKFCDKRFKHKGHVDKHIGQVHDKINRKTSPLKHKCDKCYKSYAWLVSLDRHQRSEHATFRPQLTCDFCGRKVNLKHNLARHIISCHLK